MVVTMQRWKGKVAVVTGASSGIGLEAARLLVESGMKVVGFARRLEQMSDSAKNWTKNDTFYPHKVDVTNENEIKEGFEWVLKNVGPVSVLINNAGVTVNTSLHDGDPALWKKIFDTNVLGLCIATKHAIKIMRDNNIDGHIININSVLGHTVIELPNINVYPASKHAVTALTETLRQELNSLNSKIKITSLSPGAVKTDIFDETGLTEEMLKNMPFLSPEEVADTIIFVLSTPPNVLIKELIVKPIGEKQ